ncbi:MAG: hypothetical protein GEU90_09380 [Gemmatimonas sp.]|nr:hypothetical protein [Gemmatimonas sp.]
MAATPIVGQAPGLSMGVGPATQGWPAVVETGPLLEDEGLRAALDSALPLRFFLRVELWRRGLVDRLAGADEVSVAIVQDPLTGGYSVESFGVQRRVPTIDAAHLVLKSQLSTNLRPNGSGRYYYLGVLEIETLSLSDLEELRRWLRGEVAPALGGQSPGTRAVERGLRRLMIRVIGLPNRRFEARSPGFETGE